MPGNLRQTSSCVLAHYDLFAWYTCVFHTTYLIKLFIFTFPTFWPFCRFHFNFKFKVFSDTISVIHDMEQPFDDVQSLSLLLKLWRPDGHVSNVIYSVINMPLLSGRFTERDCHANVNIKCWCTIDRLYTELPHWWYLIFICRWSWQCWDALPVAGTVGRWPPTSSCRRRLACLCRLSFLWRDSTSCPTAISPKDPPRPTSLDQKLRKRYIMGWSDRNTYNKTCLHGTPWLMKTSDGIFKWWSRKE